MSQVSWKGLSLFGAALIAVLYAMLPLFVAQGILDYTYYGELVSTANKSWHPIAAIVILFFASDWVYKVTMDRIDGRPHPWWHIHVVLIPAFIASHALFMASEPGPLAPNFITLVIAQVASLVFMCWSNQILDTKFEPAMKEWYFYIAEWLDFKKQK